MGIAVLGPLTIEGDHKVLARRDRVVLAALAVRPGEVVGAEQLADAMWPGTPPASWPKVVQGCVMRLRKVLGMHAIETLPTGYRLAVPLDEIDAQRFEHALVRARRLLAADDPERSGVVLADVLTLWRGPPFVELETWDPARIEAARLTELRYTADELYVESALRSGQHDLILAKAKALVIESPLRERRWLLLATAQYKAGQQGDALRTIRRLRATLDRELGLDPSPDVDALEQAILRQDGSLVAESALPEPSPDCPYQGLKVYDVDDAEAFFGRDADVAAGLRKLAETSVLSVVGPSGSGKSSLIRAGVGAALARAGAHVVVMTPGAHPMAALAAALPAAGPSAVLLVDQCEEAFSLCRDPAERSKFLTAVCTLPAGTRLILSFRADRIADISAHPAFARTVERGLYLLSSMSDADLRLAIEQPARLALLQVEPGLVDLLVAEVADQPGALPLLSHALAETWKRREGRTLTVAGYHDSGGIRGAVGQSAERAYERIPAGERSVLRDLLLRLVTPGPDGEPVRSRLPRRLVVTGAADDAMIDLLVEARLVTSDTEVVELAHEALARAWPRLQQWLDDDREGQLVLHHLALAADSWNGLGRPDSELYRGVRLAKALDWQSRTAPALTETEQDFIAASKRLSESELRAAEARAHQQVRINRRLRAAFVTAALLLVGALVAGVAAVRQGDRAEQAATSELARRVGARSSLTEDISQSVLLAAQGVRLDDTAETRANLVSAINRHPLLIRSFTAPRGRTENLAVSPDGRRIVSGDRNATFHVYDAASGKILASADLGPAPAGKQIFTRPQFSPDGRLIAVIAGDELGAPVDPGRPLRLLRSGTLAPVDPQPAIPQPNLRFNSLAFSANGRYLAAGVQLSQTISGAFWNDGMALVWDLRHVDRPPRTVTLPPGPQRVALSPDGRILYCHAPMTAYDVDTGKRIWLRNDIWGFSDLAITPAGDRLGVQYWPDEDGFDSATAAVVDARTGKILKVLRSPSDPPRAGAFAAGGTLFATGESGGEVIIWDVATGKAVRRIASAEVSWAVGFSPDGRTLYTGGSGGLIRVYDLSGQRQYLHSTRVAPARKYLMVLASDDGTKTAYLWRERGDAWVSIADAATGVMTAPVALGLNVQSQPLSSATWHPDGTQLAVHDLSGVAIVDARSGKIVKRRWGLDIRAITYVENGRRILVGGDNGVVYLDSGLWPGSSDVGWPANCCPSGSPTEQTAVIFGASPDYSWQHWRVISTVTGKLFAEGDLPLSIDYATYSPDGRLIAGTGANGEVLTLDPRSGQVERTPATGHRQHGLLVRFASDGRRLVSGAADGTVSLWDAQTLELLGTVTVPSAPTPVSPVFSDDGIVTIAAYDGTTYRWDTRLDQTIAFACGMAGRDLTAAEWAQAFGARRYQRTCQ
ncbi:nSTAND1 domain-containing NTPase [Kribbella sp. NPDC055110]